MRLLRHSRMPRGTIRRLGVRAVVAGTQRPSSVTALFERVVQAIYATYEAEHGTRQRVAPKLMLRVTSSAMSCSVLFFLANPFLSFTACVITLSCTAQVARYSLF